MMDDAWVINLKNVDNVEPEFGCQTPVNWLNPKNVNLYDTDGNIMMCACGEKATSVLSGKEAYVARCSKCMFGE